MKVFQSAVRPEEFAVEFRSRTPDNLLRVVSTRTGGVAICAAKDSFDPARRRTFVRYMKTEGFIPKADQVRWVHDPCWPYAAVRFNAYTRRRCVRLLVWPTLAWLLLMWMGTFC